jgi:hypothetical protein
VSPSHPVDGAHRAIAFGMRLSGKQFESIPRLQMAGQGADCHISPCTTSARASNGWKWVSATAKGRHFCSTTVSKPSARS